MKIRPREGYFLIKPKDPEKVTKSGIIIADTASKERPSEGTIIEAGVNYSDLNVGDSVLYKKWGGYDITIDSVEHLLIYEDDILGKVEK